ncbi:MAG TPA: carboxylate--amine ligase [Pseudonocardiaceae bacterium]|jgi:predicted ATP-grasp superfamily ATP-dependent carboligase
MRQSTVDISTPAVVLKFDRNPMHHGGLGAIRTLGRLGVPVHGVHEYRWAPAAGSRYLADRWVWRPTGDQDRILADLTGLARRIGRPAVLVPTDDAASIFLAEHGEPLRQDFLFPEPPADLPRMMAGKFSMYQLCRGLGVPCPETVLPATLDEARDFAARVGYPVVAKLATPWVPGSGVRSTTIVTDGARLADLHLTCARAGAGLLLQEFVPDGNDTDWFCHAYVGQDGECRPVFTGVKERSYPAHAGLTSMGRSMPNTRLATQLTELLTAIGYRGIVDVDVRLDHRDGGYRVLDLNPRLGAQFRLFRDTEGMDVVLAQYLDLTGQKVTTGEQVAGRGFVVENYDPVAAYRYWRGGQLGLTAWLDSLRGKPETAWFAKDDPVPFALMCLRTAWRVAGRPFTGATPADPPTADIPQDRQKERT